MPQCGGRANLYFSLVRFAHSCTNESLLQEQKANLSEERRQLHRAVEKEHRLIVAERAKAAIGKRLQGHQSPDNHFIMKSDKVISLDN